MRDVIRARKRTVAAIAAWALIWFVIAKVVNADIILSDGDFNDADWQTTVFAINGAGGSTQTVLTNGNPGAHRHLTVSLANAPTNQRSLSRVIDFLVGFTYDPAIDGPVQQFNHSLDFRLVSGFNFSGAQVGVGLAIRQDGELYLARTSPFRESFWQHEPATFTADDFFRLDDTNLLLGIDESSKPNLTATGSPFEIGFSVGNATSPGGGGATVTYGVDNWSLTIIPIPEPTTLVLLGLGTVIALSHRRRSMHG